jgi:hypothetical protein
MVLFDQIELNGIHSNIECYIDDCEENNVLNLQKRMFLCFNIS